MSPLFLLVNLRRIAAIEIIDFRNLQIVFLFYAIISVVVI